VKRRDCRHLIGGALTCAPRGQRLKPKPAVSQVFSYFSLN
jgi:hypothetical protein